MYKRELSKVIKVEVCLNLALRKANRVMSQIYDDHLSSVGLKCGQFSILRAMHYTQPTTNRELQDVLVLDQTTLTRNLKPIIRDGYISIQSGDDKRVKVLSLSKEGEDLYQRALPFWLDAQEQVRQVLGVEIVDQMVDLTKTIVQLK